MSKSYPLAEEPMPISRLEEELNEAARDYLRRKGCEDLFDVLGLAA